MWMLGWLLPLKPGKTGPQVNNCATSSSKWDLSGPQKELGTGLNLNLAAELGSAGPPLGWAAQAGQRPLPLSGGLLSAESSERFSVKLPAVWAHNFGDRKMIRFSNSLPRAKILPEARGPKTERKPYHIYKEPLKCLLPEYFLFNISLNVAIIQLPMCRRQMFLRRIIFQRAKGTWYFWPAFSITRSHWNGIWALWSKQWWQMLIMLTLRTCNLLEEQTDQIVPCCGLKCVLLPSHVLRVDTPCSTRQVATLSHKTIPFASLP